MSPGSAQPAAELPDARRNISTVVDPPFAAPPTANSALFTTAAPAPPIVVGGVGPADQVFAATSYSSVVDGPESLPPATTTSEPPFNAPAAGWNLRAAAIDATGVHETS